VTGDREVTTVLTVSPDGAWGLEAGTLHDVTHLPCRSARYTPLLKPGGGGDGSGGASASGGGAPAPAAMITGTPADADQRDFPVTPGAAMPDVPGCHREDYWVVFVVAIEEPEVEKGVGGAARVTVGVEGVE